MIRGTLYAESDSLEGVDLRYLHSCTDKDGKPYLWHTLLQFKARIQAMIHDELLIHCPLRFAEKVAALVGDAFKRAAAEVMKDIVIMENDYHINKHWEK